MKATTQELTAIEENLEVLLGDIYNIDKVMGLTISNKYFVAKKLKICIIIFKFFIKISVYLKLRDQ